MTARLFLLPVVLAALGAGAAGCDGPEVTLLPLAQPDRAAFSVEAGPILERRCGAPTCHGVAARPFALYARRARRLAPLVPTSPGPLGADEEDANYDATLGFLDAPAPRDTTLVRKALGVGGRGGHHGGAVFEAPSDPECRALAAWIGGTTW